LVRAGIAQLRAISAAGCVVFGNRNYYCRFGFHQVPGLDYPGPPPENFMAQVFSGRVPQGEVAYHAAFASEA
jgi:putative acetyltransferase